MKEKIFDFIEKNIPLVRELETELSKRPAISPDSGGEGEKDKCDFLRQWLCEHGIDQIEQHDAPDPRAKGGIRPNLIATIPGREDGPDKPRVWIMSHIDVVPPGDINLWETDPWTVVWKDDAPLGPRLIGRGVEDNQQGLVSSVLAALAFTEQKITPRLTVKLLFAADEEMGSDYGISWLIRNRRELFRASDMVLIPDSGDETGSSIEIAEKNLLWAKFTTTGKQTHGAHPDQGINAHLAGADLAVSLHYKLSEKFSARDPLFDPDYSTFQPTKKEANVPNINTIPGDDVFYMDMRILPQYPVNLVLEEIGRIMADIEAKYGVSIGYSLAQKMESQPTSADAPLVKHLSRIIEGVYQVKCKPIGIGGGTVGAYLRNEGIDSVVWCRINHTAHQPNEYALIANILGDAKVMALLMLGEE
ncbi:MAG: M20 family metallo-hydrolase [Treponema sp.]|jgi:succinyl-diaminopimelate desuccinylase|nr:M20 family metallo-hydrolase [Treponema sp.]